MKRLNSFLIFAALALTFSGSAFADAKNFLVDSNGMTVYVYDVDQPGISNCYNGCARAWPPVPSEGALPPGPYSVVLRKDGSKQLAYENRPLYTYVGDSKPGDTTGDGLGNVWHVVPSEQLE